eukprot:GHVR01167324.1.p1 GENE.GHVR01167324.1~~GHVR01167324.1.p1  ORF type:complete len:143 (+),score=32.40 GHVR01167324.1:21-449(+)
MNYHESLLGSPRLPFPHVIPQRHPYSCDDYPWDTRQLNNRNNILLQLPPDVPELITTNVYMPSSPSDTTEPDPSWHVHQSHPLYGALERPTDGKLLLCGNWYLRLQAAFIASVSEQLKSHSGQPNTQKLLHAEVEFVKFVIF